MEKISGIYRIRNIVTGDFYIGSSYKIDLRYKQHIRLLKLNKHHSPIFQYAFNKYGIDSFLLEIICHCEINLLEMLEQFYINSCRPYYNSARFVDSPMRGRKHSSYTKNKMKGKPCWNKGVPRTKEERDLMSKRRKQAADRRTPEQIAAFKKWHKENPSRPFLGKHHTEENKRLIRNLRKSKKKIICIQNNKTYEAQIDIARDLNIKQGHISEVLNNKRASVRGYTFKYID